MCSNSNLFKGLHVLEKLYNDNPKNSYIQKSLLDIYILLDEYEKAIQLYEKLFSTDQDVFSKKITRMQQNKQSLIKFYNFWDAEYISEFWLYQFIEHNKLNKGELSLFSVFGNQQKIHLQNDAPKIFFTGENVFRDFNNAYLLPYQHYCLNAVDLSLGYEYLNKPNYLRLPLWLFYFIPATVSFAQLKQKINDINRKTYRVSCHRVKFASLIASHDYGEIKRADIYNLLNLIQNINCAGELLNNTNELQEKFADDKLAYLRQFKFNICPENSLRQGYVTEKIFEAIMAGCIPIYWGARPVEPEILNQDAILFFDNDRLSQIKLFNQVSELWHNEKAYQEFCQIPPFKADAADIIWHNLEMLAKRIKNLF